MVCGILLVYQSRKFRKMAERLRRMLEAAENVYANLISQQKDNPLGAWQRLYYKGTLPAASCPGTVYELTVKKFQHSGDGTFQLRLTYLEAENGKETSTTPSGSSLPTMPPIQLSIFFTPTTATRLLCSMPNSNGQTRNSTIACS